MRPFKELCANQVSISEELETLAKKVQKEGSRKTHEYMISKIGVLEDYWKSFQQVDSDLRSHNDLDITSPYFVDDVYRKVESQYNTMTAKFNSYLAAIKKESSAKKQSDSEQQSQFHEETRESNEIDVKFKKMEMRMKTISKLLVSVQQLIIDAVSPTSVYTYKRQMVEQQWKAIYDLHEEIEVTADETDFQRVYFTKNTFSVMEENVQEVIMKLLHVESSDRREELPLPRIKIPVFDGDYMEWSSFYDLFNKVVNNNSKLSNAEKMQMLKSHLKNNAAKLIQHLGINDANYESAWQMLNNRYNNKRLLIMTHLENIMSVHNMQEESAGSLKEMHDRIRESLHAIKNLGIDTSQWSPILFYILSKKIDKETFKAFEQTLETHKDIPHIEEMLQFLEVRFQSLEAVGGIKKNNASYKQTKVSNYLSKTQEIKCHLCKGNHVLRECKILVEKSPEDRLQEVRKLKVCRNCLGHKESERCWSKKTCQKCNKAHHTMLHIDNFKWDKSKERDNVTSCSANVSKTVLLATAIVKVEDTCGEYHYARAMVDPGSQATFVTEKLVQTLGLTKMRTNINVCGLGASTTGTCTSKTLLTMKPRFPSSIKLATEALILSRLTKQQPEVPLKYNICEEWKNDYIADPSMSTPGPIDIIFGADIYAQILQRGIRKLRPGLAGQKTSFGWIFMGNTPDVQETKLAMISITQLDETLNKFWKVEEVPASSKILSSENKTCEKHYKANTSRKEDGTYVVKIPFKMDSPNLGESRNTAMARYLQLERKFAKDAALKQKYMEFMSEYQNLGHMTLAKLPAQTNNYFLPHQAVWKEDSTTTKLRVVFDASARSTNNTSLNDHMLAGPRIQEDLYNIVVRWRKYKIALTADIEKMYRQIHISEEDQEYHRIFWRFSAEEPIREYKLSTITYGTTSAPYLAIRTLQQLAEDEKERFPRGSSVLRKEFYVDDLLTGCDTREEASRLKEELCHLLKSGGFNLRKWASNDLTMLEPSQKDSTIVISENGLIKTLGMHWSPKNDKFYFKVNLNNKNPTKRTILSEIAKLYDPVGWLAPVIIKAKFIMQQLWEESHNWDQPIPKYIEKDWVAFKTNLPEIEKISVPRWIGFSKGKRLELHGFCDASTKAYGAAIYALVIEANGNRKSTLLTSKSRVAPLKKALTIPKLELCAANLLSKLMRTVSNSMDIIDISVYGWTDSMIVLAWIQGNPERWKCFVANRVLEINETIPRAQWGYVNTEENPADLVSRGEHPQNLTSFWWNGPSWLTHPANKRPQLSSVPSTTEQLKKPQVLVNTAIVDNDLNNVITAYSSITKLIRVISYCRRIKERSDSIHLLPKELDTTLEIIIKIIQKTSFHDEYQALSSGRNLSNKSKILSLNPFIDDHQLIRVGGRLQNSKLAFNEKHPIILPSDHHVTKLIVENAHLVTIHGGNTMTAAYIRRKFWIIRGKNLIKQVIHRCLKCARFRAETQNQLMGNLPEARVTPSKPFENCGVDYAGPLQIRVSKGRGNKAYKGYVAVFVCLATKAIHIELVSDLTTNAFIAALNRFTARRGRCSHLYSDNGTTFVGAERVLRKEIKQQIEDNTDYIHKIGMQWHFIPPGAPHFGGIWEAGVKSIKYHLTRIIGTNTLTFEEMSTVLCRIEACLNSRPLCPVSTNPHDYTALTPSHFLVGEALMSPLSISENVRDVGLVTRWKLTQKLTIDCWKSWTTEYLARLQQRSKWKTAEENIKIGDLVLLKADNVSTRDWPLARILEVHPGADGRVRVVTLKTKNQSTLKRPITKLCRLPYNEGQPVSETQLKGTKTKGSKTTSVLAILAVALCCILQPVTSQVNIQRPKSGLYVEEMGHVQLKRGILRTEIHFDSLQFQTDYRSSIEVIQRLQRFCQKAEETAKGTHCEEMYHHTVSVQEKVMKQIQLLPNYPATQSKRGLLGNLLQKVFGVNDEVYTDIDHLSNNQEKIKLSVQHQTDIMVRTLIKLNDTEEKIKKKLNHFTMEFNECIHEVQKMHIWYNAINHNAIQIYVVVLNQLATNYLEELEKRYDQLSDALFDQGNILKFIDPADASNLIQNATEKLPRNLKILPTPINRIDVGSSDKKLYVYGYFHIVERDLYQLIHITPIPHKLKEDVYVMWEIQTSLMAIDYNNQKYFTVRPEELEKYNTSKERKYLCSTSMVNNFEKIRNCIIDELYDRHDRQPCKIQQVRIPEIIWKRVFVQNTWMFIANIPIAASTICKGERREMVLDGSGIIQIDPMCILEAKGTILKPSTFQTVTALAAYNKPLPINFTMPQVQIHILKTEKVLEPTDPIFDELMKNEQELQLTIASTVWQKIRAHHYTTWYIMVPLLLIAFLFGIRIWYKKIYNQSRQRPQPAPRSAYHPPGENVESTV